jgi:hypothetical protein
MPDNTTIQIEGLDKIIAKITTLSDLKHLVGAMKASAAHIKGTVDKYPPATSANSSGQKRWYQRGYGPFWTLKDGTVHSKKTSKMLNRSWTIAQENGGLTQIVGSNVHYGPFVMDEAKQTWFHKAHGWKTVQTVVKEQTKRVVKFINDEIDKIIKKA